MTTRQWMAGLIAVECAAIALCGAPVRAATTVPSMNPSTTASASATSAAQTNSRTGADADDARRPAVTVEKVDRGLVFPEGPVWHPGGFLVFSDVEAGTIRRLLPGGGSEPWFAAGFKTNGLALSPDGKKLYACSPSELALIEIDALTSGVRPLLLPNAAGSTASLAAKAGGGTTTTAIATGGPSPIFRAVASEPGPGRRFNNVNDVAVDQKGRVWFTDPKWGAKPGEAQGVYRYSPADGTTSLAAQIENQPNGLAVSPDGRWLVVGRSGADDIWKFRIADDGTLRDGAKWADLGRDAEPDGMTFDRRGNLYVAQAGDGSLCVLAPDSATIIKVPLFSSMATNCEFAGGGDDTVLFVTGGGAANQRTGAVYRVTFAWPKGTR